MKSRQKLLVVMGAGSSMDFGIPGTADVGSFLSRAASEWANARGQANYYDEALRACRISKSEWTIDDPRQVTFESALGLLPQIMHWVAPVGDPMRWITQATDLRFKFDDHGTYSDWMPRNLIRDQYMKLMLELSRYIAEHSAACSENSVSRVRRFFDQLGEHFEVGIFTLNYDNVLDRALPDFFNGFEQGHFRPAELATRAPWSHLYHLHGSIHFDLGTDDTGYGWDIKWNENLHTVQPVMHHEHEDPRFHPRAVPPCGIIAGELKPDQLLHEPFASYYAAFTRTVHQADAILFCGYGFSDLHVNRVIENRMKTDHRCPTCIIVDFAPPDSGQLLERADLWATNMKRTLRVTDLSFLAARAADKLSVQRPRVVSDLPAELPFELTNDGRIAIWYNGFRRSIDHVDNIATLLRGGSLERKGQW